MLENAYFSHLFGHFWAKKLFSCKTAYAIFKVVYKAIHIPKIRKIYGLVVAKKCSKMHNFSHLFRHFWPKFFFSKIRLRQFFGTIKSYLDTKNQIKLWGRSSGIYSDGRTYGSTDVRVQIYSPSQILGSVQKRKI